MKENYNIESITSFEKEWIRRDEVLELIDKWYYDIDDIGECLPFKKRVEELKQKIEGKKWKQ